MPLGCSWRKGEPTFRTPSLSALSRSEKLEAAKTGSRGEAQPKKDKDKFVRKVCNNQKSQHV